MYVFFKYSVREISGEMTSSESVVRRMIASQDEWDAINSTIATHQSKPRKEEEIRKALLQMSRIEERTTSYSNPRYVIS